MSRIQEIILKTFNLIRLIISQRVDSLGRFPPCDLQECTMFLVWICDIFLNLSSSPICLDL